MQKFNDVWEAATHTTDSSRITVKYNSKRSNTVLEKSGEITRIIAFSDDKREYHGLDYNCRIEFHRDDGQNMYVTDNGNLYTSMSQYPFVGTVTEMLIEGNVENPVRAPEPSTDPKERSYIAAENHAREHPAMGKLDILITALDTLQEFGITPKDDFSNEEFIEWFEMLAERTGFSFEEEIN